MRKGKDLLVATKPFAQERVARSWYEVSVTLAAMAVALPVLFTAETYLVKVLAGTLTGMLYVRMFVIYHDYKHGAILKRSALAKLIMNAYGFFILAPPNVWNRSHNHHHGHNAKLTTNGIGSYPTVSKQHYLTLSKKARVLYLINRHPAVVLLGYFTLFIYWLNLRSFLQSPKKHTDSLIALSLHTLAVIAIVTLRGPTDFIFVWFWPFLLAFGLGSYLFYCQHNFPSAEFFDVREWQHENAALRSTSYIEMGPIMTWFTASIGLHHVHHINSKIPFYRLKEAMSQIPELAPRKKISLHPTDVYSCLRLKVWDKESGSMIRYREIFDETHPMDATQNA